MGCDCVCLEECECAFLCFHLPILNSLLAIRISALGMMGGGRQYWSLYPFSESIKNMKGVRH